MPYFNDQFLSALMPFLRAFAKNAQINVHDWIGSEITIYVPFWKVRRVRQFCNETRCPGQLVNVRSFTFRQHFTIKGLKFKEIFK